MNIASLSRRLTAALLLATFAPVVGLAQSQPRMPAQLATRNTEGDLGPYRQQLADAVAATFKAVKTPMSAFQAGLLRVSRAPQPGDYAVCLQTIEKGRVAYFAAFITAGEIETIRRAVGIDRCWLETSYSPLPPPRPPKKKDDRDKPTAR